MREISLLTFNAGLLSAFGGLLEPAPFVRERLTSLPRALADFGADLVLLQEVYDWNNVHFVFREARYCYPYGETPRKSRRCSFGSGLVVLAREPVTTEFHSFRAGIWEERLLAERGFLVVRTLFGLSIVNFHVTAGGIFRSPQSAATERTRARQIEEMLIAVGRSETTLVLAGDLNAGPNVSDSNYRRLDLEGFVDVFALMNPQLNTPTWDPANPLNTGGPHRNSPPQRCDHIFVRSQDLIRNRLEVVRSDVVLTDPMVSTPSGNVTLSDHYGVAVTFRVP